MKQPLKKRRVTSRNPSSLSSRILYLLDVTGLSQEELGNKIGLSVRSVSRLSKGLSKKVKKSEVVDKIRELELQYELTQTTSGPPMAELSMSPLFIDQLTWKKLNGINKCFLLLSQKQQDDLFKRAVLGVSKRDSEVSELMKLF